MAWLPVRQLSKWDKVTKKLTTIYHSSDEIWKSEKKGTTFSELQDPTCNLEQAHRKCLCYTC